MKLALDTNAYSAFQRGRPSNIKRLIDAAELIILPFVVDAELCAGFKKGNREQDNMAKLNKFKASDRVAITWPDEQTNELYAQIWAGLSLKGSLIPTNDIWIAALCLQHNLTLATSDAHFKKIPLLATVPVD